MNILTVDPGFTNNGWAVMDYNTLDLVDSGVESLVSDAAPDEETCQNVLNFVKRINRLHAPKMMLIEFQGCSMTLRGVEMAFLTAALALGIPAKVVYPMTIKTHFATRGLSCRGNKQNKQDAVVLVQRLGYSVDTSHVADCILMGVYMRECVNQHAN